MWVRSKVRHLLVFGWKVTSDRLFLGHFEKGQQEPEMLFLIVVSTYYVRTYFHKRLLLSYARVAVNYMHGLGGHVDMMWVALLIGQSDHL